METLQITKDNAQAAYDGADESGKKLYDENEIKKAVSKLIRQAFTPENFNSLGFQTAVEKLPEQYPEASC